MDKKVISKEIFLFTNYFFVMPRQQQQQPRA